jgi:DNA-directed RNA polymerase subunit RPC12/RpoP
VPPARPGLGPAAASGPRLKILVAGVDKDARGPIEACVREALSRRASSELWTVSLVKLGRRWSVTLHGPSDRTRNVSLTAEEGALAHAIRCAIDADATAPALMHAATPGVPPSAAQPLLVQDSYVCDQCHRGLVVAYESRPDEPKELAPIACPHCWQISQVEIGAWAAAGRDYRCEKASADLGPN